jgi:transcriptional regulator with XRE-family HTH domain
MNLTGVNPRVLVWARERSGRTIAEVAELLSESPEAIVSWEAGLSAPTYEQLEILAYRIYKQTLTLFFFPEPPPEPDPATLLLVGVMVLVEQLDDPDDLNLSPAQIEELDRHVAAYQRARDHGK